MDVWFDNEEEGTVGAVINDKTADVFYVDNCLRNVGSITETIALKVREIKKRRYEDNPVYRQFMNALKKKSKKWAKMTDDNRHIEARQDIAEFFGFEDDYEYYGDMRHKAMMNSGLTWEESQEMNKRSNNMFKKVLVEYGELAYDLVVHGL